MWFKNLLVYRFTRPFTTELDALEEQLTAAAFTPCSGTQPSSIGWSKPLGDAGELYHHATDGCIMLCLKQQEKVLPSAVINEFLDDKVREIEANDGRKPGRKERSELKEEITFELLPKAFARSRRLYAYIDTRSGLLMVDSASHNRAEALLNLLRETLGSLPVIPLKAKNIASTASGGALPGMCMSCPLLLLSLLPGPSHPPPPHLPLQPRRRRAARRQKQAWRRRVWQCRQRDHRRRRH